MSRDVLHGERSVVDVIHARHTAEMVPGARLLVQDDLGHFSIQRESFRDRPTATALGQVHRALVVAPCALDWAESLATHGDLARTARPADEAIGSLTLPRLQRQSEEAPAAL